MKNETFAEVSSDFELPAPIALGIDELRAIAAGTGVALGAAISPIHIYGGYPLPLLSTAATMVE